MEVFLTKNWSEMRKNHDLKIFGGWMRLLTYFETNLVDFCGFLVPLNL